MPAFKIAVIGGDGIGPEVIDQAVRVLEVVTKKANASFTWNKLPWSTFLINFVGCFLIGMFYDLFEKSNDGNTNLKLLLTTGFCGGFTTFSAFAYENIQLLKNNAPGSWQFQFGSLHHQQIMAQTEVLHCCNPYEAFLFD